MTPKKLCTTALISSSVFCWQLGEPPVIGVEKLWGERARRRRRNQKKNTEYLFTEQAGLTWVKWSLNWTVFSVRLFLSITVSVCKRAQWLLNGSDQMSSLWTSVGLCCAAGRTWLQSPNSWSSWRNWFSGTHLLLWVWVCVSSSSFHWTLHLVSFQQKQVEFALWCLLSLSGVLQPQSPQPQRVWPHLASGTRLC